MTSDRPGVPTPDASDLQVARHVVRIGALQAAQHVGRVGRVDVKQHGGDVVTDADRFAETAIVDGLSRYRPDDGVVAEEGSSCQGERTWFVDGLDGSLNFVRGDPFWCSAVALVDEHGPVVSAVYHPATDEGFSAERGGGAWRSGTGLTVRNSPGVDSSIISTYLERDDVEDEVHRRLVTGAAGVRVRGSGSLEMAWIAAGRGDVWVARAPAPWDWLPGALLIVEAGGVVRSLESEGVRWSVAGAERPAAELCRRVSATSAPERGAGRPSEVRGW